MKGDAAELHRWAVAVAAVAAHAVSGYVWQQRKHKGRKKRWACYQKLLTYYGNVGLLSEAIGLLATTSCF